MWPAIIGAAGAIGSALIGSKSSASSNETSQEAIQAQIQGGKETNATNIQIAEENRNWQAYMSNSAHVREINDLRNAGLNPILSSLGGNGANTPTSPIATVGNPYEGVGQTVNSAEAIKAGYQQRTIENVANALKAGIEWKQKDAEIDRVKQETATSENLAFKAKKEGQLADAQVTLTGQTMRNAQSDERIKDQQVLNIAADTTQKASQVQLNSASMNHLQQQAIKSATETKDLSAEMYAKENERKQRHHTGYVTPYLNAAGEVINSASKMRPKAAPTRRNYVTP
nr:MAG: DNA pilot protein [Microvirus sp.]